MNLEEILPLLNNVYTTVPLEEKRVLHEYAKKVKDGGVIIDIGTCDGNSAFIMALANPTVHIWTIDPKIGPAFIEKRKELKLEGRVHLIEDTSDNAIFDWDSPIDLLFIDGLHTQQGVTNDLDNWGHFVIPGETILLHDYFWYGDMVQKAIANSRVEVKLIDVPFGLYNENKVGIAITKKI
jgi:predicted O-methyltransferase YrrM